MSFGSEAKSYSTVAFSLWCYMLLGYIGYAELGLTKLVSL